MTIDYLMCTDDFKFKVDFGSNCDLPISYFSISSIISFNQIISPTIAHLVLLNVGPYITRCMSYIRAFMRNFPDYLICFHRQLYQYVELFITGNEETIQTLRYIYILTQVLTVFSAAH